MLQLQLHALDVLACMPFHRLDVPLQLTDQKIAMEVLLGNLGVTAKTNFLHIKGLFDSMDTDSSGYVDGNELAGMSHQLSIRCTKKCEHLHVCPSPGQCDKQYLWIEP